MARRRVVVWVIAIALVVAAVVAVIAGRDDRDEETAATAPTSGSVTTATATSTTTPAAPTSAPAESVVVTVDLAAAAERLEPLQIASYPITPPGDLYPTAYATTAANNRIVLLDDVTGVVRFIEGTTRMDLTQYPTAVPTIGSQSFIANDFFVGPDDVLYVSEASADPSVAIVAYARKGDSYHEVARVEHDIADGELVLGRTGVSPVGRPDAPIMPYVGTDGRPSGSVLDVDDLTLTSTTKDVYTAQRTNRTWTVTYEFPADAGLPPTAACSLCASAFLGPDNTVVLINKSPTTGGDLQTKLTLLSDQVTTYDVDWDYIGTLHGELLFARLDQDSIDIGKVVL